MDLVAILKERIDETKFGSEERTTLHSILGEYTQAKRTTTPLQFLQKWIKTNEDQKRRFRRDQKEVARIEFETEVLRSLLPDSDKTETT